MVPVIEVESILYSSSGVALLVDQDSNAQAVRIVGSSGEGVTTKDESANYGEGVRSLDVNIKSGIVQIKLTGESLQYEQLTIDQNLINGVYTTIYNNISTGKILWFRCLVSNNDVDIKVTVDGNTLLSGFNMKELYSEYFLDTAVAGMESLDFLHTEKKGKIIVLNFPGGVEFEDYFKVELRSQQDSIQMTRGLVVWARE